jgi:hypothetical protein
MTLPHTFIDINRYNQICTTTFSHVYFHQPLDYVPRYSAFLLETIEESMLLNQVPPPNPCCVLICILFLKDFGFIIIQFLFRNTFPLTTKLYILAYKFTLLWAFLRTRRNLDPISPLPISLPSFTGGIVYSLLHSFPLTFSSTLNKVCIMKDYLTWPPAQGEVIVILWQNRKYKNNGVCVCMHMCMYACAYICVFDQHHNIISLLPGLYLEEMLLSFEIMTFRTFGCYYGLSFTK